MTTFYQLEFEKPIAELDRLIEAAEKGSDQGRDLAALRSKRSALLEELYTDLSPWNTVRVARHPNRPQTRDYIRLIARDFTELAGDRRYGDDPAIVTGFARIGAFKVLIVGHQKGKTTQEKLDCHFGCAHPEGYRKALAKMKLAEKFGLPIVTFVDTPGAYPGLGAEKRGQAEAIAFNLREMAMLRVPVISLVIGEGGSGGALGIAVANRVAMLAHAWYSVISPEGCAAILWKQANEQNNAAAAEALHLTARDNLKLGIIEDILPEPPGGAHRDAAQTAATVERWVVDSIRSLREVPPDTLVEQRHARFRRLGQYEELAPAPEEPASMEAEPSEKPPSEATQPPLASTRSAPGTEASSHPGASGR